MSLVGKLALSLLPGLFALGGAFMAYRTYENRQQADTIAGAEPRDAGALSPGDGLVAVSGTAEPAGDDLIPARMADTEGVVVRTVVQERAAAGVGDKRGTDWDTIYADGDYVPFAVADGTGAVPVEPPDGDVGAFTVDTTSYESEPGEEPPAPVARWLAETDGIDAAPDQYRGYRQGVVEVGEDVHAVGEPVADGDGGLVLTGDERPDEFVVSDLAAAELADDAASSVAGYVVGGGVFLLGAAAVGFLWLA